MSDATFVDLTFDGVSFATEQTKTATDLASSRAERCIIEI